MKTSDFQRVLVGAGLISLTNTHRYGPQPTYSKTDFHANGDPVIVDEYGDPTVSANNHTDGWWSWASTQIDGASFREYKPGEAAWVRDNQRNAGTSELEGHIAMGHLWAKGGYPKVELGHRLAAALMATNMTQEEADALKMPWSTFAVSCPAGVLDSAPSLWVVSSEEQAFGGYYEKYSVLWNTESDGVGMAWESSLSGYLKLSPLTTRFTPHGQRRMELGLRMVLGVLAELNGHRLSEIASVTSGQARERLQRNDRDTYRPSTFKLTRDVKVDVRAAIASYIAGSGKSPSVRSLVRGHWRRQHFGEHGALSRLAHIEPYWRGDENAPVALRNHRLPENTTKQPHPTRLTRDISAVYFIQAGESGPVKIGHSDDVPKRLAQLQTGNSTTLMLLGAVACVDAPRVEREIHQRLRDIRMEGEWFTWDPRVTSELSALTAKRLNDE